jgi:hypothetical protein
MALSFAQRLLGLVREVLQGTLTVLADPAARAGAGLNPDVAPTGDLGQAALDRVNDYFNAADPALEAYLTAVDDVIAARDAIQEFVAAVRFAGDATPFLEYLDFVLQIVGLDVVRVRVPWLYYAGKAVALIEDRRAIQTAHRLKLDRLDRLLTLRLVEYYREVLAAQATEQERVDFTLGAVAAALKALWLKVPRLSRLLDLQILYGWDAVPAAPAGAAEALLERTASFRLAAPTTPTTCTDSTFAVCPDPAAAPPAIGLFLDLLRASEDAGAVDRGLLAALRLETPFTIPIQNSAGDLRANLILTPTFPGELSFFIREEETEVIPGAAPPSLALEYIPVGADPTILVGAPGRTRLEVGRFSGRGEVRFSGGNDVNFGLRVSAQDGALVLMPGEGDGFVQTLLRAVASGGELRINFDLTLGIAKNRGLFIEGGTGLRVTLPLGKQLGPLRLESLVLGVDASTGDDGKFRAAAEAGASLSLRTSGLNVTVDQLGLAWQLKPLGGMGFRPPRGLGLSIDLPPVAGGGYLFFDADNQLYAGAVHLAFGKSFAINGVGVVQSFTGPDGSRAYSFVVVLGVEFTPIQVGFGFTLNGVGGLFGQNRGVSVPPLQEGIKTGALEAVLFPQNPVANAPRIVAVLASVFPLTPGQTIFGPALKLGWGTPTIVKASLGLIVEFESPRRLLLLGRASADLPEDRPVIALQFDCLGVFNPSTGESSFDASLHDSKVGPFAITGDIVWRSAGGGRPFWILAVGGTNPRFEVPQGMLPPLERVGINLVDGDNPRARLAGYTALTSNTVQIGGAFDASYSKAGFTIAAHLGVDALLDTSTFTFVVDFRASVALRRGSRNLAGISLSGTISGPRPFRVDARAKLSLFFFSVTFHVSFSIGEGAPAPLPATTTARERLVAALSDLRNWSANLPENETLLVSLRQATGAPAEVVAHPLGEVAVRQRVLPLDLRIQRLGGEAVAGDDRFQLINARLGSVPAGPGPAVQDFFALGDYLQLSDDERLSRPAFENLPSGRSFSAADLTGGDRQARRLEYRTIVRRRGQAPATGPRYEPGLDKFLVAVQQGAAAQSPLRQRGAGRFAGASQAFALGEPRYTVVARRDLTRPADLPTEVAAGTTHAQATAALVALPGRRRMDLQVVALEEAA